MIFWVRLPEIQNISGFFVVAFSSEIVDEQDHKNKQNKSLTTDQQFS